MHLLIDSDSLLYKAGFVCNEPGQEQLACWQLDKIMKGILEQAQPETYQCYLSGKRNFRYDIYPEYKANREGTQRPLHLDVLKQHLIEVWGATVTDGIEADDIVGIVQCTTEGTCIGHIDKDINQIPGQHYNYNTGEFYTVTNEQGMRHFYKQLVLGDKVDNIPGFDGKMRPKFPKFLQWVEDELESLTQPEAMLDLVADLWGVEWDDMNERLLEFNQAAWALWMQRKEDDDWRNYLDNNIMEELGLKVDLIRLLPAPYGPQAVAGLLNMNV